MRHLQFNIDLRTSFRGGSYRCFIKGRAEWFRLTLVEPFYRVEDARDRKTGGTGLGLAIATRAIELHGGTITAQNAEEGGLLVEIRLPVENHLNSAKT